MRTISRLQVLRVSLSFGFFQGLMPVLGWLAGRTIVDLIADYDHWVAFILLVVVGSRMIWESFRLGDGHGENADITKGFLLLTLSVATSIDALAVGLSFAFLEVNIALASSTIGAIAFPLGRKAGKLIGRRAELVGGMVLIAIVLRILLSHVFGIG